jgi:hypothetical protein
MRIAGTASEGDMDSSPTATTHAALAFGPAEIAGISWEPLLTVGQGVEHRVLWRSGTSMAGIMRIAPGGEVWRHAHRRAHHHLWVLDGRGSTIGHGLEPGAYVHIPAGVEHGIEASTEGSGLTFLYLYEHA